MDIYSPYTPVEIASAYSFKPRDEQQKAVDDTFAYYDKSKELNPEYLWNAKMRFGKTVSALWLIERLHKEKGLKKVLIITHRPVVNASWYDDFKKVFKDTIDDYAYGTSKETDDERDLNGFDEIVKAAGDDKCVIFFASIHYLRLSKAVHGAGRGDDEAKNAILDFDWDLVIIDEAHEGTQTNLGANVINYLRKGHTKFLNLSGTPFNLLENFKSGQIYNWDYIQEQEAKKAWGNTPDNPYITLPKMEIFTFRMGEMTDETVGLNPATGKFSFSEFFRVKEGQAYPPAERGKFLHEPQVIKFLEKLCEKSDTTHYPFSTSEYRKAFRHTLWVVPGVKEAAALKSLIESGAVPALKKFTIINVSGQGDIDEQRSDALDKVLSGMGVEKIKEKDANGKVIRTLQRDDSDSTCTITLSCGRLTTGVTVPPWTAVLYLKGSDATSASTYMQTIFRVQSPHVLGGKMKAKCYVFDFAPERALTMMAETAKYYNAFESKAKKKDRCQKAIVDKEDKEKMANLLAVCPVFDMPGGEPMFVGGEMKPIDADRLFSQLNEVYVDKVVRNGFDHPSLYNYEALENPTDEDMKLIEFIGGLWKPDRGSDAPQGGRISVNDLTEEQKAKLKQEAEERKKAAKKAREEAEKKHAEKLAAMTAEEREKYLADIEEKARKKELIKQNRSKLEGLSKRIPLMMFGANIGDIKDRVTIEMFADEGFIDNESWAEFMPKEVSREMFLQLAKFYNPDIFRDAGMRIRELAQEADSMSIEDRIQRIAAIFKFFKNPDKETVLTPWEVVNRHMSDTLGGYCFFDTDFKTPNKKTITKTVGGREVEEIVETSEPRFVPQGSVTKEIFGDGSLGNIDESEGRINTRVLEINSKTGLYPLYVTYSLYKHLLPVYAKHKLFDDIDNLSVSEQQAVWDEVVANNIYVICNTPMAVRITRRTLLGFRDIRFPDGREKTHIKNIKLIERAQTDREALINDLQTAGFWNNNDSSEKMKFNAIVSNPPYQGSARVQLYPTFYLLARELGESVSMIFPTGWQKPCSPTAKGLFKMNNPEIKADNQIVFINNCHDFFPGISGASEINIIFWRKGYDNGYNGNQMLMVDGQNPIIKKIDWIQSDNDKPEELKSLGRIVKEFTKDFKSVTDYVSSKDPFTLPTDIFAKPGKYGISELPTEPQVNSDIKVHGSLNKQRTVRYIPSDFPLLKQNALLHKYKVLVPWAWGNMDPKAGLGGAFADIIVAKPQEACTMTYNTCGDFDTHEQAIAHAKYMMTQFFRALLWLNKDVKTSSKNAYAAIPKQDFTEEWWTKSVEEIDEHLMDKYNVPSDIRQFVYGNIQKRTDVNIIYS